MVLGIRQIKGASNFSVCLCLSCDLWSKSDMYGPIVQRPLVAATLNLIEEIHQTDLKNTRYLSPLI